jgi:hypothetical protein
VAQVMAEAELRQIQRQIFLADVVIGADHAALEQRPEAFDAVRMDNAPDVLAPAMIDSLMMQAASHIVVSLVLVGRQQLADIHNVQEHHGHVADRFA